MKTKILGRTGLEVPIVGLGAAFIGIPTANQAAEEYPEDPNNLRGDEFLTSYMEEDLGVRTIHAAIEAGSTLIDTAPLYGGTRSETTIGRALQARPDLAAKCTVTTKVGQITMDAKDFSFDAILRDVEASQQRLGIEQFDVLYIHDPMDIPMEQVMGHDGALGGVTQAAERGGCSVCWCRS